MSNIGLGATRPRQARQRRASGPPLRTAGLRPSPPTDSDVLPFMRAGTGIPEISVEEVERRVVSLRRHVS